MGERGGYRKNCYISYRPNCCNFFTIPKKYTIWDSSIKLKPKNDYFLWKIYFIWKFQFEIITFRPPLIDLKTIKL